MPTKDDVVEVLRQVEDPELGMDVVELGLVYDVEVDDGTGTVTVTHTLTSMGCPVGPMIQQNLDEVVRAMPGVEDVKVELTWDPPWSPERMSDDAKFILGFGWRRGRIPIRGLCRGSSHRSARTSLADGRLTQPFVAAPVSACRKIAEPRAGTTGASLKRMTANQR